jgi:hypothetical protein
MERLLRADARRAVQLADDHALGAVDDELPRARSSGNFAHVHVFFAHFVAVLEAEGHVQRGRNRSALS